MADGCLEELILFSRLATDWFHCAPLCSPVRSPDASLPRLGVEFNLVGGQGLRSAQVRCHATGVAVFVEYLVSLKKERNTSCTFLSSVDSLVDLQRFADVKLEVSVLPGNSGMSCRRLGQTWYV